MALFVQIASQTPTKLKNAIVLAGAMQALKLFMMCCFPGFGLARLIACTIPDECPFPN